MNNLSAFLLFVSAISTVLYFFFLLIYKKISRKSALTPYTYEIFFKSNKYITIPDRERFSWFYGLLYTGLFYLSVPILFWRYGIAKAIGLIAVPVIIGIGVSLTLGDYFSMDGIGIVALIILRPLLGIYVAANDVNFRKDVILKRGWSGVGWSDGKSRKQAISNLS